MMRFARHQFPSAPLPQRPDSVGTLTAMTERLGVMPAAIPAAWPAGVSQLAVAYAVCQRHDQVDTRSDWVAAAR